MFQPLINTPFSGKVAEFSDPADSQPVADYNAIINWGDGRLTVGTVAANNSGGFDVLANHSYQQQGLFPLSVRIVRIDGSSTVLTGDVQVVPQPLSVSLVSLNLDANVTYSALRVATFVDPAIGRPASSYSAAIEWGDGSMTSGTVEENGLSGFAVVGNHTYAAGGTFAMRVTVSHIDGAAGTVETSIVVNPNHAPVIDPSGNPFLDTVVIGSPYNFGTSIYALVLQTLYSDPDASNSRGIAIVAADSSNGTWQFSLNRGQSWEDLGLVSSTKARFLARDSEQTLLNFVPNPGFVGSAIITFRGWDQTDGRTNGSLEDFSVTGGNSSLSSELEEATLFVIDDPGGGDGGGDGGGVR